VYSYVKSNPIKFVDSSGSESEEVLSNRQAALQEIDSLVQELAESKGDKSRQIIEAVEILREMARVPEGGPQSEESQALEAKFRRQASKNKKRNEKATKILKEQAARKMAVEAYKYAGHKGLEALGFAPGLVGVGADLINAGWYALEGDMENAGFSAASAVAGSIPVKPVKEGHVLMHSGTKKATQAQIKAKKSQANSGSSKSNTPTIAHKKSGKTFETRPATEAEQEFLSVGQQTFIRTKSAAQAGTAAHNEAGANPVGSDFIRPGATTEMKTHYTKTISDQQLESATKQSRKDTQKIVRDNGGLQQIRIVKHFFNNPMIHGAGVLLKRYF
jgi:hypothetical protein